MSRLIPKSNHAVVPPMNYGLWLFWLVAIPWYLVILLIEVVIFDTTTVMTIHFGVYMYNKVVIFCTDIFVLLCLKVESCIWIFYGASSMWRFLDSDQLEQPHWHVPCGSERGVWTLPQDALWPTDKGTAWETMGPILQGCRDNRNQGTGGI